MSADRPATGGPRPGVRPRGGAERKPERKPVPGSGSARGTVRDVVDSARRVAYEAVAAVNRDDAYANLVLAELLRQHGLDRRDAAFATELAYGTLRAMGQLDAIIASAARRDVQRIDAPARDALRLGAYQLLHTRVPAHAAVATTVDMVRAVAEAAGGFANAVMRRVSEKDLDTWLAELAPPYEGDPVGNLALIHAHPQWIVRAVSDALGGGGASECARALAANNERPRVHLCARPGRIDAAQLADRCMGQVGAHSPYAVYLAHGAPADLEPVARGLAHVQDEGSQLVACAVADAALAGGPDQRWLDLCAGPGGKAALLGGLAAQRGARVTAVEVAAHRAGLVRAAVVGLPVDVVHTDGREVGSAPELPEAHFDRVLVDAPCTGLGSLRRRPEARWRRQPADLPALTALQRQLLTAGLRAVRPGGVVGYVTCSPHVVETRVSVGEALRRLRRGTNGVAEFAEFVDARPLFPASLGDLGDGPTVQLWPHRHGTDAMYLAVLRRI